MIDEKGEEMTLEEERMKVKPEKEDFKTFSSSFIHKPSSGVFLSSFKKRSLC